MKQIIHILFFLTSIIVYGQATYQIEELVSDSTTIAESGKYLIEIRQLRFQNDSVCFEFNLWKRQGIKWIHSQTFKSAKDGITMLNPTIIDYNSDGFGDLTVQSSMAARMANEVKKLFIFNQKTEQLTLIKNAEEYPNLSYNEMLNCIDSWAVHSGSTSYFLRIRADSLIKFASVESSDLKRIVFEYDEAGNENILRIDTIVDLEVYDRYVNYKPLVKCKDKE